MSSPIHLSDFRTELLVLSPILLLLLCAIITSIRETLVPSTTVTSPSSSSSSSTKTRITNKPIPLPAPDQHGPASPSPAVFPCHASLPGLARRASAPVSSVADPVLGRKGSSTCGRWSDDAGSERGSICSSASSCSMEAMLAGVGGQFQWS